ncbi:uncharacterized protein SPPG_07245 [Spizellomyces punctatus DAOM BR117]|uniref:UDP-glucose:Glycoprotein Glucosyltransferase n=1 Tax=Spizellomyces punctatus (strain DAOM BR117) TaxID=645134 RepID=A0A0L0H8L2_SPIPD|nr:uncharacterized protein SPPG_07245 [Spizellomyces punctatus DAOM BR117]KNC97316.1 hypothetical protein SPPG_07245 [Spizellomyces punctatus DAOM BR117]|eukprot:XP_016605356.1 hypothetical protein SPPG_07245 [Spizellomyces punctatus DAOM BR117]
MLSQKGWLYATTLLLFAAPATTNPQESSAPVITRLKTEWPAPPLILEAIEFVAQDRGAQAFDYISQLASTGVLSRSSAANSNRIYNEIIGGLDEGLSKTPGDSQRESFLLSAASLSLLKLSLATRSSAPRIQAQYRFYTENVLPAFGSPSAKFNQKCDVWLDWYGTQSCDVSEVEKLVSASVSNASAPLVFPSDHIYRLDNSVNSRPFAVLYADLQSDAFPPFHSALLASARRGDLAYVLRYKPPSAMPEEPLHVSGYGVELALKSTEYKVVDDREVQKGDESTSSESGTRSVMNEDDPLFESPPRVMALTANETQGLGLKTTQFILNCTNPLRALVDVSQNFPKFAHLLKGVQVEAAIASELSYNRAYLAARRHGLWINGIELDPERIDIFSLQRTLRMEVSRVASLTALNLTSDQAVDLLTTPISEKSGSDLEWGETFDVRSDLVVWWNNLEKDSRYKYWPASVMEVVRPSYPGQLKYLRKNLMSTVLNLDLANPSHLQIMTQVFAFIEREVPLRFGILPLVDIQHHDSASSLAAGAFYHLLKHAKLKDAKNFIQALRDASGDETLTPNAVDSAYNKVAGKSLKAALAEWNDGYSGHVRRLHEFSLRFGTSLREGAVFANGKYVPLNEEWQQSMITTYFKMLDYLMQKVYNGQISDRDNLYDHFLTLPNVNSKRNEFIFGEPVMKNFLDCDECELLSDIVWLSPETVPSTISIIVVADFAQKEGIDFALQAVQYLSFSEGVRMTFINSGAEPVSKVPRSTRADAEVQEEGLDELDKVFQVTGESLHTKTQAFIRSLGLATGQRAIVVNGRIVGPIPSEIPFDAQDFELLIAREFRQRIGNVATKMAGFFGIPDRQSDAISMAIFKATSALATIAMQEISKPLSTSPQTRRPLDTFAKLKKEHSCILVGKEENALLRIIAIVDPVSQVAQKVSALLQVLSKLEGVRIEILLNPEPDMGGSLPIKRFYRYVVAAEPEFDSLTGAMKPPSAAFYGLPEEPLYTLGMDVASSWLVFPSRSIHDLDNIRLSTLTNRRKGVDAEFLLENILVEGHARDSRTNGPPRGLQFVLGTKQSPSMYDTITMANLGYLQLKANPGVWHLRFREGRSRELYEFESITDTLEAQTTTLAGEDGPTIVVNSFEGVTVLPVVKKKLGREQEDILAVENAESGEGKGLWNQIKANFFSSSASTSANATINVFSVASGHLYERFLSIMMLSVVKNTQSPVKFWLVRNFLSPSFKEFLPHLAKAYGFEYELVTYNWPHWLRQQTEKQRTIWGYKILFLDVLFPLNLDRVIFVDADQVVRTDLKQLVDLDLHGAVYGYTPFCDDRKEMEGFRFWKHGYWKDHLAGKPYHISALYVIDLKRFRQLAAGDQLRQQYQMLSADPNSLANLDQDLPNNMNTARQLPIYSLSQDWLWCETWCSDESLKTAKTIDLCNNPLTKEPKLERAKRILPEWEGLDAEVAAVAKRVGHSQVHGNVTKTSGVTESISQYSPVRDEL